MDVCLKAEGPHWGWQTLLRDRGGEMGREAGQESSKLL